MAGHDVDSDAILLAHGDGTGGDAKQFSWLLKIADARLVFAKDRRDFGSGTQYDQRQARERWRQRTGAR